MLAALLLATIGGFSFDSRLLSDRLKIVHAAPDGDPPEWKEHIQAIVPEDSSDADLARLLVDRARLLAHDYYAGDEGDAPGSFEAADTAGSLDVYETVTSASADLVCVHIGASYYTAGMAHPNSDASRYLIWSRRLHRTLAQRDVLAIAPDRGLRLLALAAFDNREAIDVGEYKDGLPLDWSGATIGPAGITWSFGPYELGGYLSGGSTTLTWTQLAPYLRHLLPFSIFKLRPAIIRSHARP